MDLRAILYGVLFSFIWASAFTSARMLVAEAPPITTLGFRFLLAAGLCILIATAAGQRVPKTPAQRWSVILFGLFQNVLYLGANFVAMQWIEASLAVVIASAMPLIAALLAWRLQGERLSALQILGLGMGFLGVIAVMSTRINDPGNLLGIALAVFGLLALTSATLTIKAVNAGENLLMVVGLQSFVAGAVLLPIGLVLEDFTLPTSPQFWGAFVYTTLAPGILAVWLFFQLVASVGTTKASSFHFLNPFFGVLIAWALLSEALTPWDALGVVVISAGLFLVQRGRRT